MASRDNTALANHVLQSIQKDLDFLKSHQYINTQAYNDILHILPTHLSDNNTGSSYSAGSPYSNKGAMPSPAANYNNNSGTPPPPPPNYSAATSLESVEALYDFQGQNPQDLSFRQGDIIQVTEHVNNDWWKGSLQGRTGLFPSGYVQKCIAPRQEKSTPPSTPARNSMPPPPPSMGQPPSSNLPPPAASTNTYAYPPPPATPSSNAMGPNSYAYPPPPPQQQQPQQYNNAGYTPPPTQPAPEQPAESSGAASKASGLFHKVGGQLATAATYGFGGTIGSEAAHALF
ncbi:SH3 domain-containing protein [Absidia repens]|uniref:SH3 domain-containing protein n=1 Tax=Absidia repens TaxID=90262 RepID=A0A1X2IHR7_9FUNG|nr:SH3 domain-containing protein [Absidia repens]